MEQKETKEVITNFRQRTEDLGLSDTDLESLEYSGQEPKGISVLQMNSIQQAILSELLDQYINRMPKELAIYEKEKVTSNFDSLFFAWAGGIKPNQPHYYRIQGTQLLVEYDNTQNDSNHILSLIHI